MESGQGDEEALGAEEEVSDADTPYEKRRPGQADFMAGMTHLLATKLGGRVEIDTAEMSGTAVLATVRLVNRGDKVLLIIESHSSKMDPNPNLN